MKVLKVIAQVVLVILLELLFVGAGFLACALTPVTHLLSSAFAQDELSPYGREQLVAMADAARDFAFVNHDELSLYQAMYEVAADLRDATSDANAQFARGGFPALDMVHDTNDCDQLRAAFEGASETYCFSADAISHLDDCYAVARAAYMLLAACAACVIVFFAILVRRKRLPIVGRLLRFAGALTIATFAILGVWALVDFYGFFVAFHRAFFSQGNWTFAYDSLLICALPTEFWMGMGIVFLGTSVAASVGSLCIGTVLARKR